jgi:glycine reductase
MLIKKMNKKPYQTELVIPKKDVVPIAPAIKDLAHATIAMLNTGGIVPVDNPDRIQSASATRWGRYDISNMQKLEKGEFKTIHAGFDPAAANEDPNVIMPIDAMRAYEKEGKIGRLHPWFYTTVGTGTTEAEASRMAKEIIPFLQEDHVDGVIMIST